MNLLSRRKRLGDPGSQAGFAASSFCWGWESQQELWESLNPSATQEREARLRDEVEIRVILEG